jgi:hypothetical protein
MKIARGIPLLGALLLSLTGTISPASAQSAPQGTYLRTCTNVSLSGQTLRAHCRMDNGRDQLTELHDVGRCVGDIANHNGLLQCQYGQAPNPSYGQGPPQGPGGSPPGYGTEHREGWGPGREREERCDRLRNSAREIRERLNYGSQPWEREGLERRLSETREEFRSNDCGEWRN